MEWGKIGIKSRVWPYPFIWPFNKLFSFMTRVSGLDYLYWFNPVNYFKEKDRVDFPKDEDAFVCKKCKVIVVTPMFKNIIH